MKLLTDPLSGRKKLRCALRRGVASRVLCKRLEGSLRPMSIQPIKHAKQDPFTTASSA
jgi:hypothetical protein